MGTAVICILLFILCVFGVKNYCMKLAHGCCGTAGDGVKRIRPADSDKSHYLHRYEVAIGGMTCKNCAARVENAFHVKEGFLVKVHLSQKSATVFTKQKMEEKALREIIVSAGYEYQGISQEAHQRL